MSKSRLLAVALAVAGLAGAAGLGYRATSGGDAPLAAARPPAQAPVLAADKQNADAPSKEGGVRVEAPQAEVNVDKDRGKVSVKAPYTDVQVDPENGRVRVRAPYVDLDIRW